MCVSPELVIEPGTMVNRSRHEDDDALIATKRMIATIIEKSGIDAIKVIIPDINPDEVFWIHQPEKKKV